jgi:hypothetical protein
MTLARRDVMQSEERLSPKRFRFVKKARPNKTFGTIAIQSGRDRQP